METCEFSFDYGYLRDIIDNQEKIIELLLALIKLNTAVMTGIIIIIVVAMIVFIVRLFKNTLFKEFF